MDKNHILEIYIQLKSFDLNAYAFLEIHFKIFKIRVQLARQMAKGKSTTAGYRKKIPVQGKSENSFFIDDYF